MSLTIYGSPRSRTMRVLWMAEELALDYTHVPLEFDDPCLKEPEFLALNPAGAVPVIDDAGFALAESLAINLYLARKYATGACESICPQNLEQEASAVRWTLWAQGHLEPWLQRDSHLTELTAATNVAASRAVRHSLETLDRALHDGSWLVGEEFTVADLNVASVLSPSRAMHADLAGFDAVSGWLARCYERPAARAVRARFDVAN